MNNPFRTLNNFSIGEHKDLGHCVIIRAFYGPYLNFEPKGEENQEILMFHSTLEELENVVAVNRESYREDGSESNEYPTLFARFPANYPSWCYAEDFFDMVSPGLTDQKTIVSPGPGSTNDPV